jgi:hypothetical protein
MRNKRRSREFWEKIIVKYGRSSGKSQAAFARENGVKFSTFQRWLYKLRRERDAASDAQQSVQFVEVVPSDSATHDTNRLYLGVPGGVAMEFRHLPAPGYLAALSRGLTGRKSC